VIAAAPQASRGQRYRQPIAGRRGNATMNSIVMIASEIVRIEHGTVICGSTIRSPAITLSPRHAVIVASSSASLPNVTLSWRWRAARSTSHA
jgi:hypothetical protein